jgi:uncharacterized protein (DUF302 family)
MGVHTEPPTGQTESLGEHEVVLQTDHDTTMERVQAAFTDAGFRVATMFSPSEQIQREGEGAVPPYHVIGFGIPQAGEHALEVADGRIGALFPCNVVVWADKQGFQHVYHLNTMRMAPRLDLAPDDDSWGTLVAQLEGKVDDAFGALEDRTATLPGDTPAQEG